MSWNLLSTTLRSNLPPLPPLPRCGCLPVWPQGDRAPVKLTHTHHCLSISALNEGWNDRELELFWFTSPFFCLRQQHLITKSFGWVVQEFLEISQYPCWPYGSEVWCNTPSDYCTEKKCEEQIESADINLAWRRQWMWEAAVTDDVPLDGLAADEKEQDLHNILHKLFIPAVCKSTLLIRT